MSRTSLEPEPSDEGQTETTPCSRCGGQGWHTSYDYSGHKTIVDCLKCDSTGVES